MSLRRGLAAGRDEGDQALASEQTDMALMTRERLAERIERLTAALERVSQGQYGHCSVCGRRSLHRGWRQSPRPRRVCRARSSARAGRLASRHDDANRRRRRLGGATGGSMALAVRSSLRSQKSDDVKRGRAQGGGGGEGGGGGGGGGGRGEWGGVSRRDAVEPSGSHDAQIRSARGWPAPGRSRISRWGEGGRREGRAGWGGREEGEGGGGGEGGGREKGRGGEGGKGREGGGRGGGGGDEGGGGDGGVFRRGGGGGGEGEGGRGRG